MIKEGRQAIVHPDRVRVAIADDARLVCWDTLAGRELWRAPAPAYVGDFCAGGERIFASSLEELVGYDAASGARRFEARLDRAPGPLVVTPDGETLLSLADSAVIAWDLLRGDGRAQELALVDTAELTDLKLLPGGERAVSIEFASGMRCPVRVFRLADGALLHMLEGHDDDQHVLAVAKGRPLIATSGKDFRICLHHPELVSPAVTITFDDGELEEVAGLAFDEGDRLLVAAHDCGSVTVWDVESGELVHRIEQWPPELIAWSDEGQFWYVTTNSGAVRRVPRRDGSWRAW